ncbi:MAG: hypothetical protein IJR99_02275 [Kiritimatiellae bacterium]|nr:hypothetical protein [Kiritimatiellia bacterium]
MRTRFTDGPPERAHLRFSPMRLVDFRITQSPQRPQSFSIPNTLANFANLA